MKKIKLGIIGTGLIWELAHMPCIDSLNDEYEVNALCVRKKENMDKWVTKYPNATIYNSYTDLLKDENVDAVLVAPPINLNGKITLAALNAKKNVFEEKPMCLSYDESLVILEAQQKNNRTVFMLEQFAYSPSISYIKELIESEKLGKLVGYQKTDHSIADPNSADVSDFLKKQWRIDSEYPLGAIFDGGAHAMAVLQSIYGMPNALFATGKNLRSELGEYDFIVINFIYDNNVTGVFSFGSFMESSKNREVTFFENASVESTDYGLEIAYKDGTTEKVQLNEINHHKVMWSELYANYVSNEDSRFSSNDASNTMKLFDAISTSIDEKKVIEI